MGEVIIRTKLTPEKNISNLLNRDDLLEELKKNSDKQLIVLSGGAGYGKTSLAKQFVFSGEVQSAWCTIDETDNNLFVFLAYLTGAVSQYSERAGESASRILESIRNREGIPSSNTSVINTVCGTLANDIANSIKDELYIVLDDLHLLPDEVWVREVLDYLLKYLPSNVHLLVTTREKLPIDTGKLKAKRKFFEINDGLKFTGDEVRKLAGKEYNLELTNEDIPVIEKIDGWITGLHLYLQGDRERGAKFIKEGILPENMYSFFAEDIFNSERDEVKEFLLNSAVLENFTSKDCDKLFKMTNSADVLRELFARNVFINRTEIIDGSKPEYIYNYQSLFRDFLKRKLDENVTEAERSELHRRVGEHYLNRKEQNRAIKYFLKANDHERALRLITEYLDSTGKTDLHIAREWIDHFPDTYNIRPEMLFYRGWMKKNLDGDYESAVMLFKDARKADARSGKIDKYLAEVLIGTGKTNEAISLVKSALEGKINKEEKAALLYWYGTALSSQSEYDAALEKLESALEIENGMEIPRLKYSILNELGNINLIKGDYTKAAYFYESVINNISNVYNKFQTINNIVQVFAYEGNFQEADRYLDEAEKFVERYPSQYFKLNYLLSGAYLEFMKCDYENSIEKWKEFVKFSMNSKLSYYIYIGNLNLAICNYYCKNFSSSEEYFKICNDLVPEFDEGEKVYLSYWKAVLEKETDESAKVQDVLEKSVDYFTKRQMQYDRVHVLFQLASVLLKQGTQKKAKDILELALKEGEEKNFITIFQKEFLFDRRLFDLAMSERIHSRFIEKLQASIFELEESGVKLNLDKIYDIKLKTFGEVKLWIRGKEVPDGKWIRKIRKLIFVYILLSKKTLTKDILIDLFYPDSGPDNANSIFHQTLSNIRSIFKWALTSGNGKSKKDIPEYLIYEGQRISLNQDYIYLVDAFEFEKLYKQGSTAKSGKQSGIYETALRLYEGEFLEGYYQPWCEEMREQYNNYFLSMVESLIDMYKKEPDYEKLAEYSRMLIKADSLNEEAYVDVIEAEMKMGNSTNAKDVYKRMIKTFKKELGDEPSTETINKINKLLK